MLPCTCCLRSLRIFRGYYFRTCERTSVDPDNYDKKTLVKKMLLSFSLLKETRAGFSSLRKVFYDRRYSARGSDFRVRNGKIQ